MEPQRSVERDADDERAGTAADVGRVLAALYGDGEETAEPERAGPRVHGRPRPARSRRTTRSSS
jgi:hypothetical protein